jgi:hypothetical protein
MCALININTNHLAEEYQSAYCRHHSTETALLCVQNDILLGIDNKKLCLLVLLDLSAAFDTIDHSILIKRLSCEQGITGTALKWIQSYLSERKQSIWIDGTASLPRDLPFGVPQGSVLGPKLYVHYVRPIGDIIRRHGLHFHLYADDTQLFIFFDIDGSAEAIECMEQCIGELRQWMKDNLLKLNDEKTEVLLIGAKAQFDEMEDINFRIGNTSVSTSPKARNIGAIFDKHMNMEDHITSVCQAANYHIRNIGKIRRYLTRDATEKLVHAFVSTKLDYTNSLLVGLPKKQLAKLQRVQNTAARVVMRVRKHDHITPVLKALHWLPIPQRIDFKILLLVFKCLHGLAPTYLRDLLKQYTPARTLRSTNSYLLQVPKSRLKSYGDRAFPIVGPRLWNALPLNIKNCETITSFKSALKSHLYKLAFDY